ncbi:hypothetical protein TcWFU_009431 [Taenia crassiceps]|uniref:Complex 1 LYR protein domain-containing protein n=1 Tax=Taenia crassiceps TaxID=6207 RepID=A0ABR4QIQ8_9CEST
MTTAGRPTWNTAKGGKGKWEGDLSALSKQYSVRDLPSHTKLKYRQEGQGRPEDLQGKDFKKDLEEKERQAAIEKSKKGLNHAPISHSGEKRPAVLDQERNVGSSKRPRQPVSTVNVSSVPTANLDADDPWEEDYTEEELKVPNPNPDSSSDDNDDESDEEDEEALLAELAKIKRERAEEAVQAAAEKKAAEETIRMENILKGNPLLNNNNSSEFRVKRRWDDDVVFKNCARGEFCATKFIMLRPHSQLQRQVLKLYKDYMIALRPGSKAKLEESSKSQIRQAVRDEFRKNAAALKKTHFVRIETLVRQGRRLLEDLEAGRINCGLVSAFGYGSVVVPQYGRSATKSQLDFILIVDDPLKWHTANLKLNPSHYSGLASICDGVLLKYVVNKWPHPTVYYNPLVTWRDCADTFPPQVIKYGVVGYKSLMSDLNSWCDLYIAGRLHKPVVFVPQCEPPPKLRSSLFSNLRSALAFSLLQLDLPLLNEDSLYHSLASISYRGDWRLYFGEDRRKVERLITGEPRRHGFHLFTVEVPGDLRTDIRIFPQQKDQIVRQLLECLPSALCRLAVCEDSALACHQLSEMTNKERRMRLQHAAASIVRRSSYRQTALGLFSAGLSRSIVYSFAKFRKMLASLSS